MSRRPAYQALVTAVTPLALGYLLWRSAREPGYREHIGQRFGHLPRDLPPRPLWCHAASMGEVRAVIPLLRCLRERRPDLPLVVSTMTPSGRDALQRACLGTVTHVYLPFDLAGSTRRFIRTLRPRLGLIVEMEIWPNLLASCREAGLPLFLVNARMSERSHGRYRRFPHLLSDALSSFELIAADTEASARRLADLGAPRERLLVNGNLKHDQTLSPDLIARGHALRGRIGAARPVWVAASTHEGEETAALAAHRRIRERFPDAMLILVPRHPQRFDGVVEAVATAGLTGARQSSAAAADTTDVAVLVGDTMGEMPLYLAAADVAFVGGSLVRRGGHNPLEPAALSLPVLLGPHVFNIEALDAELMANEGARRVTDADSLARVLLELLADPRQRRDMGAAAASVVAANRGAVARLAARVAQALDRGTHR